MRSFDVFRGKKKLKTQISVKMVVNIGALGGRLSFLIKTVTPVRFINAIPIRSYSQFPLTYIKPTFKKEEQAALRESGEALKIAHTPILPALTHNTSSEFHDDEVSKFINYIMRKGKKKLARDLLSATFENIKRIQLTRYNKANPENRDTIILDPVEIFHKAVLHSTPVMELVKMKRGGVTYQVPVPILEKRQRFLAMNWLIRTAKDKDGKIHFPDALANELIDAAHNQGRTVRKKQELHKQCEANRAYAHYRWG